MKKETRTVRRVVAIWQEKLAKIDDVQNFHQLVALGVEWWRVNFYHLLSPCAEQVLKARDC